MLSDQNNVVQKMSVWLGNHPWLSLFIGLLLVAVLSSGMAKLRLETDYKIFFKDSSPEVERFNEFQNNYGREDTLFVSLSAEGKQSIVTADNLLAISDFTLAARSIPHVRKVVSIANFPLVEASDTDIAIYPAFNANGQELNGIDLNYPLNGIAERLLQEPSARYKLISDDENTAGILLTLVLPEESRSSSANEAYTAINELISKNKDLHPYLEYRLTGSIALDAAFAEANEFDLSMLFPAAVTIIVLLASLIFRSIVFYLSLSLVVTASTLACLGFAGWAGIPLSSVSISSPVIVIILAVAEMVHFLVAWRQQQSESRMQNVAAAIQKIIVPAALTSITTIAGFMTLLFSATPPFQHLGMIASFGIASAFVFTLLLGTPLFSLVRTKKSSDRMLASLCAKVADYSVSRVGKITAVYLSIGMVVISSGIVLNKIDDNYVHYFGESFDFRKHSDFIDEKLTGIYSLEYNLVSETGSVYSDRYLRALRGFSDWAVTQPGVRSVETIEDTIAQVNKAFNGGDSQLRHSPQDNDLIRQYSVLYEMSVPQDFDFSSRVAANEKASRVTVYLSNLSISEIAILEKSVNSYLNKNEYFGGSEYKATGTSIIFSHIGLNNIYDMLYGTITLFLMAGFLMWIIFRTPAKSILATIANIVPAIVTLGVWGLLVGRIGMGGAAVVTVSLGLVIDDTIHLGYRYLKLRQLGQDAATAMRNTIKSVGPAIFVTTLVLALGFFLISFSAFEINASIGLMVATAVMFALVFDLFVLPAALVTFDQPYFLHSIFRGIKNVKQTA